MGSGERNLGCKRKWEPAGLLAFGGEVGSLVFTTEPLPVLVHMDVWVWDRKKLSQN